VRALICSLSLLAWSAMSAPALAQPPAPPKIWTVAVSAGLALTSGNTDTSNVNAAYDIVYNPQTRNVVKSDGLFLRGETDGVVSAYRSGLNVRDEYSLTTRVFVFGQNQYLRDEFKNIDYLLAPTGGVGYKVYDTAATKLAVDGSVGAVWEKNPGVDVNASGALALSEKLAQTLPQQPH
jgi:putative salt-induced outer membrane protein YdiY